VPTHSRLHSRTLLTVVCAHRVAQLLYVGINLGCNFGPVVDEEFTANKKMTSVVLAGQVRAHVTRLDSERASLVLRPVPST
jgi:hypothetical protein